MASWHLYSTTYSRAIMFFLGEVVLLFALAMGMVSLSKSTVLRRCLSPRPMRSSKQTDITEHTHPPNRQTVCEKSYKFPPLKCGTSPHMTMGLRRLDHFNWLTVDEHYVSEHEIRARRLDDHPSSVIQCLPSSESACQETFAMVTSFLVSRYPAMFKLSGDGLGQMIRNLETGEAFPLHKNPRPLETAARLAMEDFNILIKDPIDEQYRLQASATLFPAGWKLEERIGSTLEILHCPVPDWKKKLGASVNRYFDHLSESNTMERHTIFVQNTPVLFQDEALCSVATPSTPHPLNPTPVVDATTATTIEGEDGGCDGLITRVHMPRIPISCPYAIPDPCSSCPSTTSTSTTAINTIDAEAATTAAASMIHIRRERQTFLRLPMSSAILFTVRTYITPLTELDDAELKAFMELAANWSGDMARYKGRAKWWAVVLGYWGARGGDVGRMEGLLEGGGKGGCEGEVKGRLQ